MPYDLCDPCCDKGVGAARSVDTYRAAVLNILCDLVGLTPGPDSDITLLSVSGRASSNGDNLIADLPDPGSGNANYIYRIKLSTANVTTALLVKILDGAGGTEKDRITFQTPANVSTGAVDEVTPPGYIYKLENQLNINLSAGVNVDYAISYYVGAAA